jgi:hypothetical protein
MPTTMSNTAFSTSNGIAVISSAAHEECGTTDTQRVPLPTARDPEGQPDTATHQAGRGLSHSAARDREKRNFDRVPRRKCAIPFLFFGKYLGYRQTGPDRYESGGYS